ncbi:MAG TPA: hypothetical protein VIR57_19555 [Chloroflexota bacterium]
MRIGPALAGLLVLLVACGGSASVNVPSGSASASAPAPAASSSASASPSLSVPSTAASPPISVQASPSLAPSVPDASPSPSPAISPSVSSPPLPASPSVAPKPASPAPAVPASPASQATVTITNADNGKTLHAAIGANVIVALKFDSGMRNWTIQAPDPAVLAPAATPAPASSTTTQAYRAAAAGTASIRASDRAACAPGQVCPHFVVAFNATVVVN